MLQPISMQTYKSWEDRAMIWNARFEERMNILGLSQRKFIDRYRNKFHTGSQSDVSNWKHVGEMDGKTGELRQFPKIKTMLQIADILDVSVSYLIGESDFESFEMERTSNYIGLSSEAINAIRSITSGKAIAPYFKYPDSEITQALEHLLTSPFLLEYLENIVKLERILSIQRNPKSNFESAIKFIPVESREDAIALFEDPDEAITEKGIEATNELWAYAKLLENAVCDDMHQPDSLESEQIATRYILQENNSKIIDDITSRQNDTNQKKET